MRKFLFIMLVSSVAACTLPPQGDPKVDSIKGLAFVCEEYRIILRDIREAFQAGHIKATEVQSANAIRKRVSPICAGAVQLTKEQALREVSSGLRSLVLIKGK